MSLLSVVFAMASSVHVVSPPSSASLVAEDRCANATSHYASKASVYRGDPARPQKLTDLPPAEAYAAVYRVVDGCAVPVLYREVREVKPPRP